LLRPLLTLPLSLRSQQLPRPGQSHVHTQPFAFRAPQEDDESVKNSNLTRSRSSAFTPAPLASRPGFLCASDYAISAVILLALSVFCEASPAPLFQADRSLPAAGRDISPFFSVSSAFLCVKSFDFLCSPRLPKRHFLFDTNKPFSCTTNFATRTKQSTSFILFDTNERSSITTHQSLITAHHHGAQLFHG
jgi:hypothetical protein